VIKLYTLRVKQYIGAYAAAMGGLDCVVFTGGIGENFTKVCDWPAKDWSPGIEGVQARRSAARLSKRRRRAHG